MFVLLIDASKQTVRIAEFEVHVQRKRVLNLKNNSLKCNVTNTDCDHCPLFTTAGVQMSKLAMS